MPSDSEGCQKGTMAGADSADPDAQVFIFPLSPHGRIIRAEF